MVHKYNPAAKKLAVMLYITARGSMEKTLKSEPRSYNHKFHHLYVYVSSMATSQWIYVHAHLYSNDWFC